MTRGQAVPGLAPAKHRAAGSTYWLVEEVPLHPDHHIPVERAAELGLVTRAQIARAFGVNYPVVNGWASRCETFPARRAKLEVLPCEWGQGPNFPQFLYSAAEVIAWSETYRPAQRARHRLTHRAD